MGATNATYVANVLIEVRATTSKGLGVFAKVDIPHGTRVISEAPLLDVSDDKISNAKDIVLAFEQLSAPQQELYLQLHAYACDAFKRAAEREMEHTWQEIPKLHRTVLSVYAANAFGSVFWLGSRINHSCLPNLNFSFNPALQQETFHAI